MRTYELTCTRLGETLNNVLAWAKAEETLGLKNSIFICEDGRLTQYVDSEEGNDFYDLVDQMNEEQFNQICEDFFEAIKEKDLEKMHVGLAIFDEMDSQDLGNDLMKRRLRRIRESTHEESYKLGERKGIKNFIIFKGKTYLLK